MTILAWEASWTWVGLLFGLGVILALAELLIPSHGLLTVLSVGAFLSAVVVAFRMGQTEGVVALIATLLLAPLLIYVLLRAWPHTPLAKRLILAGPSVIGKAGDLAHLDPKALVGRIGVAKTMLRPSGKMVLDGRPIDCLTQGDLVPAGRKVRILAVEGAKVVVEPVAEPDEAS
jgi:membrane-bound serine protease (ClpP class)